MEIHERIKLIRTEAGLSQEEFATSIGLKRANYAQIEAGNQKPTIATLSEIVRIYNKTYEYVIDGIEEALKVAPKTAPIVAPNPDKRIASLVPQVVTVDTNDRDVVTLVPVKAAAGYLNGYADPEYIERLPTLYLPGLSGDTHRAFEIKGQSMMPNLHSGAICVGRWVESIYDIKDRRVYIIVSKYDGIVVKRVLNRVKQDGKLIMISDNDNKKEFPNFPIEADDVLEIWYWRGAVIREVPEPGTQYVRFNDLESRLSLLESRLLSGK